jgi:hypothetical protein
LKCSLTLLPPGHTAVLCYSFAEELGAGAVIIDPKPQYAHADDFGIWVLA